MKRLLLRVTSIVISIVMITNASATPLAAFIKWIHLPQLQQRVNVAFTDTPTEAYLGPDPGKDEQHRGGMWTDAALQDMAIADATASTDSSAPMLVIPAANQYTGETFKWEGRQNVSSGDLNSVNGNKVTAIPLFGWTQRGGFPIQVTLYHNSRSTYHGDVGYGWTVSPCDMFIKTGSTTITVEMPDGKNIPYSINDNDGLFYPPAGIHDSLVQNANSTYTLTTTSQIVYNFTSSGYLSSIVDRNGNTVSLTRNSSNYCTAITDQTGRAASLTVNGSNQLTAISDPQSHSWSITHTTGDDISTISWPALGGTTYTDQFTYSTGHAMLTHVDKRGKTWSSSYDSNGRLTGETDPLSHSRSWTYNSTNTVETDPLSHTVTDNYSSGKLSSRVDESSYSASYTYSSDNQVTSFVDKRGKTWSQTFDSKGNRLTLQDPLSHTTTWTYNSTNDPLTETDPLSHVTWTKTYDSHGNCLTVKDALNRTVTNTWNSTGTMATTKTPLNNQTNFSYNTNGDCTSITDPLSNATSMGYDSMGRLTSKTDPLTNEEDIAYDVWGRPTTYTHPDSSTVVKTYDACGNFTGLQDENSHSGSWTFDDAGRCTQFTNARGDIEYYGYDNANRRTTVQNGRGKTRTYTFTSRGDVYTLTMPDSAVEAWSHDGNGDVTAYENPLSQTINYTFDNASRETTVTYPDTSTVTFNYDNANRKTSMVDSTGTYSWTYSNANQVTALNTPQGNMTYTFNSDGTRATMVEGVGTTTYGYDNDARLTSLQNPYSETTSWTYDADSRVTQQTFSSGAYTTTSYDSRSRPTAITHKKSDTTTISSESYVYDYAGNLSSKTVDGTETDYTYDAIDQLLTETRTGYSATYVYDANGNRTSKTLNGVTDTYTIDDGDKLTSTSSKSFGYDAAGRCTSVTVGGNTTNISYDYEDRITGITYPDSSTNSFSYNGVDARVSKTDSGGTNTYKRDGVDVTSPVLSDSSAAYTPGISDRRSGASKFYHTDRLGTDSGLTNSSQATTDTKLYDAFGLLISSTGSTPTPFGFVGKGGYQEDKDSGLQLLGHRYYDPSTGRFLSRDKTKEGRNWCAYVRNNPTKWTDQSGNGPDDQIIKWIWDLINKGDLPPDAIDKYKEGPMREKVHRDIGDRKFGGGGRGNPDLNEEEVKDVLIDNLHGTGNNNQTEENRDTNDTSKMWGAIGIVTGICICIAVAGFLVATGGTGAAAVGAAVLAFG